MDHFDVKLKPTKSGRAVVCQLLPHIRTVTNNADRSNLPWNAVGTSAANDATVLQVQAARTMAAGVYTCRWRSSSDTSDGAMRKLPDAINLEVGLKSEYASVIASFCATVRYKTS